MPDSSEPSRPLSGALVGTWELIAREDYTTTGERRFDPALGGDPIGLLVYDRTGHFAAQFMKRDRSGAPEPDAAVAAPNNSSARGGYDAYFGLYTVDDTHGTVTQRLIGALSPENVGLALTRAMTVIGDELTIRLETATSSGEPITRTLRWRRIG
jgi:hypothetical protein